MGAAAHGDTDQTDLSLDHLDGVMPANQARSREAQARLLEAGEQVFAEKGYDDAHVSDIAAAANCSIGSFYRRFRDKEALFRALHVQFAARMRENSDRFFRSPRLAEASTYDVIRTLVTNTARVIERHPGFFRALFQRTLAGGIAVYVPALRAADQHRGRALADFLRGRGMTDVDGEDLDSACILALRTIEAGLVNRRLHASGAGDLRDPKVIDGLTRMLGAYLGVARS
jgi:AcrR family transcriptional regulator